MKSLHLVFAGALLSAAALATVGSPGLAAAGGGCRGMPVTEERGTTAVMDERSCFSPTILYVGVGEQVTWTNKSTPPHTVTGANVAGANFEGTDVTSTKLIGLVGVDQARNLDQAKNLDRAIRK